MKKLIAAVSTALMLTSSLYANSKNELTDTQAWIIESNIENMARVKLEIYGAEVRKSCLFVYTISNKINSFGDKRYLEKEMDDIWKELQDYSGEESIFQRFKDYQKKFFRDSAKADNISKEEFEKCTSPTID